MFFVFVFLLCFLTRFAHMKHDAHNLHAPCNLNRRFKQYEDRRKLLTDFDFFAADDRILPMLPALLGVKFFAKKKQPAPINVRIYTFSFFLVFLCPLALRASLVCLWFSQEESACVDQLKFSLYVCSFA
jgi:hypothetical protein